MLDVDKQKLKERYIKKDWNYVFREANNISDFLISSKFKIYDFHTKEDIKQECLLNFWNKVITNKCDPEKNVFSFIWKNSTFKILEILRKESKRRKIATFMPISEYEDYITFTANIGKKYAKIEV